MLRTGTILRLIMLMLSGTISAADTTGSRLDQIQQELEQSRYRELARIQADPRNQLAVFSTDGCSGGLSDGWRYLANVLPIFKQKFGNQPPYEHCCVAHDRAYWRGEVEDGYARRMLADQTLRRCVADFGRAQRDKFAREFHLSPAAIENNFEIVAALMYRAVRAGGMPCTAFPWRWGYGWPACHELDK